MSKEEARRFFRDSQTKEDIKNAFAILRNETLNIINLSKELGYDFTPSELIEVIVEEISPF